MTIECSTVSFTNLQQPPSKDWKLFFRLGIFILLFLQQPPSKDWKLLRVPSTLEGLLFNSLPLRIGNPLQTTVSTIRGVLQQPPSKDWKLFHFLSKFHIKYLQQPPSKDWKPIATGRLIPARDSSIASLQGLETYIQKPVKLRPANFNSLPPRIGNNRSKGVAAYDGIPSIASLQGLETFARSSWWNKEITFNSLPLRIGNISGKQANYRVLGLQQPPSKDWKLSVNLSLYIKLTSSIASL